MDELSGVERDPRKTFYDHKNPPPNMEAAEQRKIEVAADIAEIEVALEFKETRDFADQPAYSDWRQRAMHALGFRRRESNFLMEWIALERKKPMPQQVPEVSTALLAMANGFATDLKARYAPRYTETAPPLNISDAQSRLGELRVLSAAVRQRQAECSLEGGRLGFAKKRIALSCAPLEAFSRELGVEMHVIRSYVTNFVQKDRGDEAEWKSLCAAALTRAVGEGFKLTEREQVILERLKRGRQSPET